MAGYDYVGFTLKDLYNQVDSGRRYLLVDGNAHATIRLMYMKTIRDPLFIVISVLISKAGLLICFGETHSRLLTIPHTVVCL